MHPRTTELLGYLDSQYESLRVTFESVPAEQRTQRPSTTAWSVDDVIAHLAILEHRLAGIFDAALIEARTQGLRTETDMSPVLPTIDVTSVLDRRHKIVAPDRVDPRHTGDHLGWSDFESARGSIKKVLLEHDGFALGEVSRPHPVFGPLNLYNWFAFVAAHGTRHAEQIREIVATPTAAQ
jgi:hypothetical protein